jgi:hypothetical protein
VQERIKQNRKLQPVLPVGAQKIKKLHFLLVPSHVPTSNRKFIGSKLKGQLIIAATVLWLLYGWFCCNAVWPFQISVGLQ